MTEWTGVGCSAWDVVTCAGTLAGQYPPTYPNQRCTCFITMLKFIGTIAACIASGITWGAALAECITGIIGTADACWGCVCDVIEWLEMGSC